LVSVEVSLEKHKPIIILEFDLAALMMSTFHCTNKSLLEPLFKLGYKLFWCPNHRSTKSNFKLLGDSQMTNAHEKNSLAVLVHLGSIA
jgi:hypothetical protein